MMTYTLPIYILLLSLQILTTTTNAQTLTTTNADGATIVEFITTPPGGLATTSILSTLTSSATTQAVTEEPVDPGPIGQPPVTTPASAGGPTPFIYTTTNADGGTITVHDTFTPSFKPTITSKAPASGTILDYSSYLAMVGTHTVGPVNNGAAKGEVLKVFGVVLPLVSLLMLVI